MKSIFFAIALLSAFQPIAFAREWTGCSCKIVRSDEGFGWYIYGTNKTGRHELVEESASWDDKGTIVNECNSRLRYITFRKICS